MRFLYVILLMNFITAVAVSAPPKLEIPAEIQASGEYVSFIPNTDAVNIAYISMSGVEPFPSGMLRDQRAFLLPVRGLKDGRYSFIAMGIKGDEYTRTDFVIIVGKVNPPVPPPTPEPKPPAPEPPNPSADNAPTKTDGLHVAIIYETGQRVTQQQFNVMYGLKVRSWLDANCDLDGKTPQYRLIDQNQIPTVEPWLTTIKRPHTQLPWLVVMNGRKYLYEGALSQTGTEEDFVNLLKKYKPNSKTPDVWKTLKDCPDGNCPLAPLPRPTPLQR
jgi:hypothetical protein